MTCVYVGLTGNPRRRFRDHLKTRRFKDIIGKVGLDKIEFEQLTDFLPQSEAAELETKFIKRFEAEGYELLNRAKAGGLGGIDIKWTNDAILKDARKYKTVMEWANAPGGAYAAASKKGILEKAASHLKRQMRAPGSWTLEEVIETNRYYRNELKRLVILRRQSGLIP